MKKLLRNAAIGWFCLLFVNLAYSQTTYYWVGGGGDWGDLSHWANTSGGLGSVYGYPPSPLDDVVFDQNSGFTATSRTVTTPSYSGVTMRNMTWNNAPNNPIFDENAMTDFVVLGNLTLQKEMTFRAQVLMMGNQNATVTSNGAKIGGNLYIDKEGASVSLADSLALYHVNVDNARTGTIVLSNGTFNTNGHTIYANGFVTYGVNPTTFNMANTTMHLRSVLVGAGTYSNRYFNTGGTLTTTYAAFKVQDANKTIDATNSVINVYNSCDGFRIDNNSPYTFNEINYIYHARSYATGDHFNYYPVSNFGPATIRKITLDTQVPHGIRVAGGMVDTIISTNAHNTNPSITNGDVKYLHFESSTVKHIEFEVEKNGNYYFMEYRNFFDDRSGSYTYDNYNYYSLINIYAENSTINTIIERGTYQSQYYPFSQYIYFSNNFNFLNNSNIYNLDVLNTSILTVNNNCLIQNAKIDQLLKIVDFRNSTLDTLLVLKRSESNFNSSTLGRLTYRDTAIVTGNSNSANYLYFDNIGRLSTNTSTYRFAEYNINGWMEGSSNTFDTLVFSPGYTYRFGNGVSNTVRKKWYASGNPCYFTEVYNVGSSGTATINLAAGVPNEFDYIRFWGVKATAASPIYAGVRSINIANNQHITFAPYDALALLYPFGTDREVRCHSNYPFTLNTEGFYGNTNTTFTWQDGSTLDSFVVTQPGVYEAHAYYGRNCYYSATYTVLDQLSAVIDSTTNSNLSCDPSAPTGDLLAIANGEGTGPYTYAWTQAPFSVGQTPVQTNALLSNVEPGLYKVEITDGTGCVSSAEASIYGPSQVLAVTSQIYNDCNNTSVGTGIVQVNVQGGTAPYTYSWADDATITTSHRGELNIGSYEVTVTDAIGCQVNLISQVTDGSFDGSGFDASITLVQPIDCELTGSATVVPPAELTVQRFEWSHDSALATATANNIPFGDHTVIIVSTSGCADLIQYSITPADQTEPTFTLCPADITMTTSGSCGQVVTWQAPVLADVQDNCSIASLTSNFNSGVRFPVGITPVTYTATDIFGNEGTCTFNITVVDNEDPVFVNCIADLVIQANTGNCTATATWPTPVVLDNCGIASITSDFNSGATFPVGINTITYTAVDVNGNSNTCSFRIIVKAHPNDFKLNNSCPTNTTVYTSTYPFVENQCSVPYVIPSQTFTSTCTTPTYVQGTGLYTPGSTVALPMGSNPIMYKLTNGSDTLSCSYAVTVVDNMSPVYTFNNNQPSGYLYVYPDTCGGYKLNLPEPTWRDNCGIDSSWRSFTNGTVYPPGTSTYLYMHAVDVNGLQSNIELYLYVYDDINTNVSNCPSTIYLTENTCGGAVANWTPPTINHKCYTVQASHQPGDIFPIGYTYVTYSFFVDGNEVNSCGFYVYVEPSSSAVTNCPSDIVQNVTGSDCGKVVTWTAPTFTSPCAITSVTSNHQSGDIFPVGITNVVYTATLADNSTMTCSFNVTVRNPAAQPPSVQNCPANFTVYANAAVSCTEAPVNFTAPTFLPGTCQGTVEYVTVTPASFVMGDNLPLGVHAFNYTSYNSSDVVLSSCSFNVTVVDTTSKVVLANCPQSLAFIIDPTVSCTEAEVSFTSPTFTSQGCTEPVASVTSNINSGAMLPVGVHNVIFTAFDGNNNSLATCAFNITVQDDAGALTVTCPGDLYQGVKVINVIIDPTTCNGVTAWDPPVVISNGGCTGTYSHSTQLTGIPPGAIVNFDLDPNLTLITYGIFNTNNDLMTTCQFYIRPMVDEEILARSIDTVLTVNPLTCTAVHNWDVPVLQSNCLSSNVHMVYYEGDWNLHGIIPQANNGNQQFPIGEYLVRYEVYAGNYNIPVNYRITVIDGGAPDFGTTCPADTVRLYTSFNQCEAVANWPTPVAIAGSCITPSPSPLTTNVMPNMVLPMGNTTINYSATYNGLTSNCTFIAQVLDTIKPTIYVCPANITANISADCEGVATWTEPAVFDNCSGVTAVADHANGALFPIGTTLVTYTVADMSNNTTTCSFNVTIVDNVAPVITNCPPDLTVNSQEGVCGSAVTWTAPTATDNCTNAALVSSFNPGDVIPMGVTTIFYTAMDDAGNTATCSFNITVVDIDAPTLMNCPSDITVNSLHNICAANVSWNAPTANDPCGSTTITSTHSSGDLFTIGTTIVTYFVRDAAGNVDSCSFNVTVTDITAPQITACPPNQELQLQMNQCDVVATWVSPIAIDNCSDVSLIYSHTSGSTFPIGTTIVTYIAEDTEGLQDVCTFSITVTDPGMFCGGSAQPGTTITVPDAFTPDGDGKNDVLVIEGLEHYPDNELVIFNRWGTEVYKMAGYNNSWGGKINVSTGLEGSDLPTGTYYYVIDTNDKKVGVLKGFIYLQR